MSQALVRKVFLVQNIEMARPHLLGKAIHFPPDSKYLLVIFYVAPPPFLSLPLISLSNLREAEFPASNSLFQPPPLVT